MSSSPNNWPGSPSGFSGGDPDGLDPSSPEPRIPTWGVVLVVIVLVVLFILCMAGGVADLGGMT